MLNLVFKVSVPVLGINLITLMNGIKLLLLSTQISFRPRIGDQFNNRAIRINGC